MKDDKVTSTYYQSVPYTSPKQVMLVRQIRNRIPIYKSMQPSH